MSIRYTAVLLTLALLPLVGCQESARPGGVVSGAEAASKPVQGASIGQEAPSNSNPQNLTEKDANATGSSESKQDDWQRRKDCAEQAERVMKDTGLTGDRNVIGWENHYNSNYGRCFVLVTYKNPDGKKIAKFPAWYFELYDAFDRRLLSDCQDGTSVSDRSFSDKNEFCNVQEDNTHFDCRVCRSFIKDRMEE